MIRYRTAVSIRAVFAVALLVGCVLYQSASAVVARTQSGAYEVVAIPPLAAATITVDGQTFQRSTMRPTDVAPNGVVVGHTDYVSDDRMTFGDSGSRGFAFDLATGVTTEIGLPGFDWSSIAAINASNAAVGTARNTFGQSHAFIHQHGASVDLNSLVVSAPGNWADWVLTEATDINDLGDIVGLAVASVTGTYRQRGFRMAANTGVVVDVGTLGGSTAWPRSVNNNGEVVGMSTTSQLDPFGNQRWSAFAWSIGAGMRDLGSLPNHDESFALRINGSGTILGFSNRAGLNCPNSPISVGSLQTAWTTRVGAPVQSIGALPDFPDAIQPSAMNNNGVAVGRAFSVCGQKSTLFAYFPGTGMTDLKQSIPSPGGWTFYDVTAINDHDVMAGIGSQGAFVLRDPAAQPSVLPVAQFTHPEAKAGRPVTFNATGSSDADGVITKYEWDFDYATTKPFVADTTGAVASATFASPGTATVALRITDNRGGISLATATFHVFESIAPEVTIESPRDGAVYALNQVVTAKYDCTDNIAASCVPSSLSINTALPGSFVFTVTGRDAAANVTIKSVTYRVRAGEQRQWQQAAPLPVAQYFGNAITLSDGAVLLAGGMNGNDAPTPKAFLYDSKTNLWSALPDMSSPRADSAAVTLADGRVLIAGGMAGDDRTASADIFDPVTRQWSAAAPMNLPRNRHTLTLLASGKVLATGGYLRHSDPYQSYQRTAEVYDPMANTWTNVAMMAERRVGHSASLLPDGRVLIVGGADYAEYKATVEYFTPSTNTFSNGPSLSERRYFHSAVTLPDGRILIAGGMNFFKDFSDALIYNSTTSQWQSAGVMSQTRVYFPMTVMADGRVLAAGGYTYAGPTLRKSADVFDPITNAWSAAADMATARSLASIAPLEDGGAIVVGGSASSTLSSVEIWNAAREIFTDSVAPIATISQPMDGAIYRAGEVVQAAYVCSDAHSAVVECVGTRPNGSPIDTTAAGVNYFIVHARDAAGNATEVKVAYTVRATPQISWNPAAMRIKSPIGPSQLNAVATYAGAVVAGTYEYSPQLNSIIPFAGAFPLRLVFRPSDPRFEETIVNTTVTVDYYAAAMTVSASPSTSHVGELVTLEATLLSDAPVPAGNFEMANFSIDGAQLGSGILRPISPGKWKATAVAAGVSTSARTVQVTVSTGGLSGYTAPQTATLSHIIEATAPRYQVVPISTLGGVHGFASDVNETGTVVGVNTQESGWQRAFVWTRHSLVQLDPADGRHSAAFAINNDGAIAGSITTANERPRPAVWSNGAWSVLSSSATEGHAYDINDRGEVVGQSGPALGTMRPFIYRDGALSDLLPNPGAAYSINTAGAVVGSYQVGSTMRAFLWHDGALSDVVLGGDLVAISAVGIDDAGRILGQYERTSGVDYGTFILESSGAVRLFPTVTAGNHLAEGYAGGLIAGRGIIDGPFGTFDINALSDAATAAPFGRVNSTNARGWVAGSLGSGPSGVPAIAIPLAENDTTPREIQLIVTGQQGASGWFTSTVVASWRILDPEGILSTVGCEQVTVQADTPGVTLTCTATSAGGVSTRSVTIRKDATPPVITSPLDGVTFDRDAAVTAVWSCTDAIDPTTACEGSVARGSAIDTSVTGDFSFTVTATDSAGNRTARPISYFVAPATNAFYWSPVPATSPQPSARSGHGMVYDRARQKLILIGGRRPDGTYLNDVWERDSATGAWEEITPATAAQPIPRHTFGVAFDEARRVVVVYAGRVAGEYSNVNTTGDSWEWNPQTREWRQVSTDGIVFGGFIEPSLAWDPVGRRVIMFGGRPYYGTPHNGTTYAFSGNAWTPITSEGPEPRAGAAMSTDTRRNRVVLHGGWNRAGSQWWVLTDTWEWDGAGWTRMDVPGAVTPPPLNLSSMVFDESRMVTVLFGGAYNGPFLAQMSNGTWEWNGRAWRQRATNGAPAPRVTTMAYDPVAQRILLFGGNNSRADNRNLQLPDGAFGDAYFGTGYETVSLTLDAISVRVPIGQAATIRALVSGPVLLSPRTVTFDLNRDGVVDASAQTDQNGVATVGVAADTLRALLGGQAGVFQFSADVAAEGIFTAAHSIADLFIDRHLPLLSVIGGTFTFDGTQHHATASITGLAGIDLGSATVSLSYSPGNAAPIHAGTYTVTAAFSGNDEYDPVTATTTLVIERATPVVAWQPAALSYRGSVGSAQLNAFADAAGTFEYSPRQGTVLPLGVSTLAATFTPQDSGNYSAVTVTRALNVIDDIAPAIVPEGDRVVEAVHAGGSVVAWPMPVAVDEIDGTVPVSCTPATHTLFPIGSTTVTCIARDQAGNESSTQFSLTVRDTTKPTIYPQVNPDSVFGQQTENITVRAVDAVGVTAVSINGISASLWQGTARDGFWRAVVPISQPVPSGGALKFVMTAADAAGNSVSSGEIVVDNDGIASSLDKQRTTGLNTADVYSNDFVWGTAAGTVVDRAGWRVGVSQTAVNWPHLSITGAGEGVARIAMCGGSYKELRLDRWGETAAMSCDNNTVTVKAYDAMPTIEVDKQISETGYEHYCYWQDSGSGLEYICQAVPYYYTYWYRISLAAGQVVSTGSPITADPANSEPVKVELLRIREDDRSEVVVGTFALDPGEIADTSVTAGGNGADDLINVQVLSGSVDVTIGAETQSVTEGESTTLIHDTIPPTIVAPAMTVEATSVAGAVVNYTSLLVTDNSGAASVTTTPPAGSVLPIGNTTVTVRAIDAKGNPSSASFIVSVRDTTAPTIATVSPDRSVLTPPNHRMVPVQLAISVSDLVDAAPVCRVESATSNEPDNGLGDGDTAGDIRVTGALSLELRAERSGKGAGRIYTMTVACSDQAGNVSRKAATVSAPKNR
jgi:probable HAF family extracellular repeat protein